MLVVVAPLPAQERHPIVALSGGLGNVLGGLGTGVDYYLADSRLSLVAGLGYWPSASLCDKSTFSGAGALRAFVGRKHRLFLEGSYSLIQVSCIVGSGRINRHYGPGLSLGYRYTSSGGFTVTAAGGVGDAEFGTDALILLGVGYTWQR